MANVIEVGKALWEAHVDRSKLKPDLDAANAEVAAAGAKGEQAAVTSASTTTAKIAGISRTAASTVALGAGAMFGVATKLAADGENAMAQFQAQTGATQQEAEAALGSMNRLAGQNLQSFGTIAEAYTQVKTNLGLTGQAAEDATNQILKFSTATGTDAVANVTAFDDVLDSWGKTAADLPAIMDQIVASTQTYGGTVTEATSALTDMAPALRAMGMSLEDGVGLLDVFRASGVDAASAAGSLNIAVKKLKPGQDINDLIAQLGAIQDPTLRAQKAIELFGRSGAKLGNAIQPGMTSLDDFKIAVGDAAGATTDAANAIQSTLPNQVKLAVSGALAQARSFATDLGPALLGVSSLASIGVSVAGALKLDVAFKAVGSKAWSVLVAQAGAAGAEAGAAFAGAETAGGLLGTVGALLAAAAPIAIPVSIALVGGIVLSNIQNDPAVNKVYEDHKKALDDWIASMNAAAAMQAVLSAGVSLASAQDATNLAIARRAWGSYADQALASGYTIADAVAELKKNGWTDADVAKLGEGAVAAWQSVVTNSVSYLQAHAHDPADVLLRQTHATTDSGFRDLGTSAAGSFGRGYQTHFSTDEGARQLNSPAGSMTRGGPGDVAFHTAGVHAAQTFTTSYADQIAHMSSALPDAPPRQLGVHFGQQFVVGFKSTRDSAKSEWQQYMDDLAHPERGQKTKAWVIGKLTGEDLANGLKSSDPVVRHSAEQEQQNLRVTLQQLIDAGYPIGKKTLEKLGLGIVDGKLVAVTAAKGAKTGVNNALNNTSGVYGYGADLVNRWAAGMAHAGINAATIAQGIVARVGGVFLDDVPIPADAPEHIRRIGEYGGHFIDRWVGGMWEHGDAAAARAEQLGARIAGSLSGLGFGPLQSIATGQAVIRHEGTIRAEVRLSGDTIAAARAQGATWDDVGRIASAAGSASSTAHLRTIGARQYA